MADAPLSRLWKRAKSSAPRQKVIASAIASVRRSKPRTEQQARDRLVADAARQGVDDLSDKELRVMIDAVTTSAKDATTQAVSKGMAGVRSMWTGLQTSSPAWLELPDDVAALNIRSDQERVYVPVAADPEVLDRIRADVAPDADGARTFNCWLGLVDSVAYAFAGETPLGTIAADAATPVFDVLARRRAWTPARLADDALSVELPDRP